MPNVKEIMDVSMKVAGPIRITALQRRITKRGSRKLGAAPHTSLLLRTDVRSLSRGKFL